MNVFWTPVARQRLAEIEARIAENNPAAARRIAARLVQRSYALRNPPVLGKRMPQYREADVRELLVRPFRVIFRVLPDRIEILTLMHYRQLLPSDLKALLTPPANPTQH
jgi:plasmid stabilization system protein ParE